MTNANLSPLFILGVLMGMSTTLFSLGIVLNSGSLLVWIFSSTVLYVGLIGFLPDILTSKNSEQLIFTTGSIIGIILFCTLFFLEGSTTAPISNSFPFE